MMKHIRRYHSTEFMLYFSHANCAWVFRRTDTGATTEHSILEGSEADATKYFNDKVSFFCDVVGIQESDMRKG